MKYKTMCSLVVVVFLINVISFYDINITLRLVFNDALDNLQFWSHHLKLLIRKKHSLQRDSATAKLVQIYLYLRCFKSMESQREEKM